MVLCFDKRLKESLDTLGEYESKIFPVPSGNSASADFLKVFGEINWQIVDLLNNRYSHFLAEKFDLYNWLDYNEKDEVAYFLAEAGQNCFNHAERPAVFHLYLGKEGFILGIEQEKPFHPEQIDRERIKENQGAAFEFFRNCKNTIFFDNPEQARIAYLEFLF